MNEDLRPLSKRLGHRFDNEALLEQALTHRSAGSRNNERLEFLGDALLGLIIAEALWARFPEASEGQLSRLRASLVNKERLAGLARELALGDYLRLGPGEWRTGGHGRDSILADALEATFASVYLDRGFDAVRRVILGLYDEALAGTRDDQVGKDPKTRLQEWLQGRKRPLPEYEVREIGGSPHAQQFLVGCRLTDDGSEVCGQGTSRRRAEQAAAEAMLRRIEDDSQSHQS